MGRDLIAMAIVLTLILLSIVGVAAFIDYQFAERNAELFIECMDVADTNEQVVACNARFHR